MSIVRNASSIFSIFSLGQRVDIGISYFKDLSGHQTTIDVDPQKLALCRCAATYHWCRKKVDPKAAESKIATRIQQFIRKAGMPTSPPIQRPFKHVSFAPKVDGTRIDFELCWSEPEQVGSADEVQCHIRAGQQWYALSIENMLQLEQMVGSVSDATLRRHSMACLPQADELVTYLGGQHFDRYRNCGEYQAHPNSVWGNWRETCCDENLSYHRVIYPTFFAFLPHLLGENGAPTTILELCGGDGAMARAAFRTESGKSIAKWILVERNASLVEKARRNLAREIAEGRAEVIQADVTELEFAAVSKGPIDAVVGVGALAVGILPSKIACVRIVTEELPKVLREGAKLFLASYAEPYVHSDDLINAGFRVTNTHNPIHDRRSGSAATYVAVYEPQSESS